MNKTTLFLASAFVIAGIAGSTWYLKQKLQQRETNQPLVVFTFLGKPGSGKGTLAENCVAKLNFKMLSTGNLIREHIAKDTEMGRKLKEYTNAGKLVPDELIIGLAKEWITKNAPGGRPLILDGFPRTSVQAEELLTFLSKEYPGHILKVVQLQISDDGVVERISRRVMCPNHECNAIYNLGLMKDKLIEKCTKCGSQLVQRADDREDVVRNRLATYAQTNQQLVDTYRNKGITIQEINVETMVPEQVFEAFKLISTQP